MAEPEKLRGRTFGGFFSFPELPQGNLKLLDTEHHMSSCYRIVAEAAFPLIYHIISSSGGLF